MSRLVSAGHHTLLSRAVVLPDRRSPPQKRGSLKAGTLRLRGKGLPKQLSKALYSNRLLKTTPRWIIVMCV